MGLKIQFFERFNSQKRLIKLQVLYIFMLDYWH